MDNQLIWWGLSMLAVVTVYWAAVWWWLPMIFRDRDREDQKHDPKSGGTR